MQIERVLHSWTAAIFLALVSQSDELLGIQLAYDVHSDGVSDTSNLYVLGTVPNSRDSTNKLTVSVWLP